MNPISIVMRFLGGQARNRRNVTVYFALATSTFRLIRRVTSPRQRIVLRFAVKPGETYELRGVRRGR